MCTSTRKSPGRLGRPLLGAIGLCGVALLGCSREHYREKADRDVYALQQERAIDPRWAIPPRPVEPDPRSRMRDANNPDREPFPPDDPAALEFQVSERLHPWRGFQNRIRDRGVKPIEDAKWLELLPRDPDGSVRLSRQSAMQLAVVHGRDYQFQVENLYLAALAVSLARFQFQVQPFFNESLIYQRLGAPSNESNQFQPAGQLGFRKQLYTGAQLLANFANNLVFEYSGAGFSTVASTLTIAVTQPLLRGAFARIVTQPLSLQERGLLYAIRDFARFRRILYVDVTAAGGYLGLLRQLQSIRNSEENLRSLERNLRETEALVRAQLKSRSERDQVAVNFQQAEVGLLSQRANLQTSLDAYRVQSLGLPPDLPMTIDDEPLKTFELSDPRIDALRASNEELNLRLLRPETTPSRAELAEAAETLRSNLQTLSELIEATRDESNRWRTRLGQRDELGEVPLPEAGPTGRASYERELAQILADSLTLTEERLDENLKAAEDVRSAIPTASDEQLEDAWQALQRLVGQELRGRTADVFAVQTQVRVFLIELPEVTITPEQAVAVALANRQDLMNARAAVADAWRNVEVAANALRAGLNLTYLGTLANDPDFDGILRFDASAGIHRFGLEFDAPLVRRAERNAYRAAWIAYQRSRREYMRTHDEVVRQVRLALRNLELGRRQFEIGREQLVTSVRQVEESEYNLRFSRQQDASYTLLLLAALQNLLDARNTLIGTWVDYESARLSLYRDLDLLNIDAGGNWTNEHVDPALFAVPIVEPLPGPRFRFRPGYGLPPGYQPEPVGTAPSPPGADLPPLP